MNVDVSSKHLPFSISTTSIIVLMSCVRIRNSGLARGVMYAVGFTAPTGTTAVFVLFVSNSNACICVKSTF